ncbi:site-specific integrase [Rhodospirillaceae bacterium SYSU D60014]|uniref:tyrosine-type recombinase/integrase n=1 Tax=Virgifigura deserti TaxID=2268457 RepID=UPI000E6680DF
MASVRKRKWKTAAGEERIAWIVDYLDSRGERQRPHFTTKKEADRFRIRIESQLSDGTYRPDADKVTVKEVGETFVEHCEGRMRRNERMTRKMLTVYKGHINNHILHAEHGMGGRKLSQLTARSVGEFRDKMREAGVTVPTARKILATLHSLLEFAISQDWVAVNAAHGVRVIGPREEGSKKIVPPSKEDMRTVIEAAAAEDRRKALEAAVKEDKRKPTSAEEADLQLVLLFAASTGARAGEQWALRWRDLDLATGELHITRRVDVYGEEGAPKSAAGVRTVPVSGHLVTMLKVWKARSKFSKPDDLVFPNSDGNHTGHDNFVKRRFLPLFDRLREAHKEDPVNASAAPQRFNWHGLRHFAVSCWIDAGLKPKTVQTFAGHASLQVTMDRYGHLFPSEDHRKAMDQIAKGLFA